MREEARDIGMGSVGLSWGIFGDPDNFMAGLSGQLGSGFLTTDHTEFLFVDLGPTFTYKAGRAVQVFADVHYMMRLKKTFSHGATANVGVRYLFD